MRGISRNSGFTLIEIMLALAIGSLLVAALYASLFGVIRGKERAEASLEESRSIRSTLDLIRREISSAIFSRNDKFSLFTAEDRDRFGEPASLFSFTAIASSGSGSLGDQQLVRYRPVERGGRLMLVREVKSIFDINDPQAYPQLEEIESFLVECHDGSKWLKTWDASVNGTLPAKVRVTIALREGENRRSYSVTAIPRIAVLQ